MLMVFASAEYGGKVSLYSCGYGFIIFRDQRCGPDSQDAGAGTDPDPGSVSPRYQLRGSGDAECRRGSVSRFRPSLRHREMPCQCRGNHAAVSDYGYQELCFYSNLRERLEDQLQFRKAFLDGQDLKLTPKEFAVLCNLARHMGEVVTKEQLYQDIWENDYDTSPDATLKFHVKELRKKLTRSGAGDLIETAWGIGYILHPNPDTRQYNVDLCDNP